MDNNESLNVETPEVKTLGEEAKASVSETIKTKIEFGSDIEKCSNEYPFPDLKERVKGLYYTK